MRILDLSEFNDVTNWQLVKANADIVILRIGYRGRSSGVITYDKRYKEYRKAVEQFGIPFSLYFFPASITKEEAIEEADFVAAECKGMMFYLPIFADSELADPQGAKGRSDQLSKDVRTKLLQTFCNRLQSKGVPAGIYASTSWWDTHLDKEKLPYSKWIAQWGPRNTFAGEYLLWQYSNSGAIPGIDGRVDMSCLASDVPVMQKNKLNDVLSQAKKWIGTKEDPAGSNNVIFNTDYYGRPVSGSAYPWCCAFIWDVFRMANASELFYDGKKTAYCPTVESFYRSIGRWFSTPKVGDLALFGWGGKVAQHIGIVEAVDGNVITTIEGNTSMTSNDNGGAVMRRTRTTSNCTGFARPAYGSEVDSVAVDVSDFPDLYWGDRGAYVTLLQNALTLRGFPTNVTNVFDDETQSQVLAFQKAFQLLIDGIVGQQTWTALFS